VRVIVRAGGPPLACVKVDGGPGIQVARVPEKVEHGIRVGDVAIIKGLKLAAGDGCVLGNDGEGEVEVFVVDIFGGMGLGAE
jgi:hypothetical protein